MKGFVKNLTERNYGFIKAPNGGEYFFHKADFTGYWEDLVLDWSQYKANRADAIEVTFDITDSPKGPRAANVRRVDHPN